MGNRRKARGRGIAILLAAAGAAVALVLLTAALAIRTEAFRGWLAERAAERAGAALERPVRLRLERVGLLPLEVEVVELTIGDGEAPFVEVERGVVGARWRDLVRRRARLTRLQVDGLRVDLRPGPPDEAAPGDFRFERLLSPLTVDRLELEHGSIRWGGTDRPLRLSAEGVTLAATLERRHSTYRGHLAIAAARLEREAAAPVAVRLETGFFLDPHRLTLEGLALETDALEVAGRATIEDAPAADHPSEIELQLRSTRLDRLLALAAPQAGGLAGGTLEGEARLRFERFDLDALSGAVSARARDLRWAGADHPPLSARVEADLAGGGVELRELRLEGEGAHLEIAGWLGLSSPSRLSVTGEVDEIGSLAHLLTAVLARDVGSGSMRDVEELAGALALAAEVGLPALREFDPRAVTAQIDVRADRLRPRASDDYLVDARLRGVVDHRGLRAEELRIDAPGAAIAGGGGWTAGADLRLDLRAEIDDLAPTARALDSWAARLGLDGSRLSALTGLGGDLDLDLRLAVSTARIADPAGWRGRATARARRLDLGGETPIALALRADFSDGAIELTDLETTGEGLSLRASGRFDGEGADRGRLSARVDLAPAWRSWRPLVAAWSSPGATGNLEDASGQLELEAEFGGPWVRLDGTARVAGRDLALAGRPLGALRASAVARGGRVEADGRLAAGEAELGLEALLGGGEPARLAVTARQQPLAPLLAAAALAVPARGDLDGRLELTWPGPGGRAELELTAGAISELPLETARAALRWTSGRIEVERAEVRTAGGEVRLTGALGEGGDGIAVEATGLRLGDVLAGFGTDLDLGAELGLEGTLRGSLARPELRADVGLTSVRTFGLPAPSLTGPLTLAERRLTADLASADGAADVRLDLDLAGAAPWTIDASYPLLFDLSTWLAGAGGGGESTFGGRLRLALSLPAGDRGALTGSARIEDGRLTLAGLSLAPDGPIELELEPGRAALRPVRWLGPETELRLAGELATGEAPALRLAIDGRLDLRALEILAPELRTGGAARLELAAAGPLSALGWSGRVAIEGGRLRHPALPVAVQDLAAALELGEDRWRLPRLTARVGGGEVEGEGWARMDGLQPDDYHLALDGRRVRLAYPEGFRSELDARLELGRTPSGDDLLLGRVEILRGLYDRDLELEKGLLARRRDFESANDLGTGWLDRLALALDVEAEEGLWVRNDVARIESRGRLRIEGSVRRPEVSGRVEALEGGTVTFREQTYFVSRGALDFPGVWPMDPLLDVRAETSVGAYDVTLAASGKLSDPVLELSSEPPLSQTDVVTLLLTGRTRDQLGTGGGLSEAQAASYLSSRLARSVEPALKRSLGLDEVRLDPVLVEGQANPTARVTAGKALSGRLYATYSGDLGRARQDIYQLRYRLADRLSLVGLRDEDGSLSADVRYGRRTFLGSDLRRLLPARGEEGPKIAALVFRGQRVLDERALRKLSKLAPGDRFRRSLLLESLERIRAAYLERHHPEAEVEARVEETARGVRLEIEVDEGRRVIPRLEGAPKAKGLEVEVLRAWRDALFRDEALEESARRVEEALRERGFARAVVRAEARDTAPGEVEVRLAVTPGPRVRVTGLRVEGAAEIPEARIKDQILTRRGQPLLPAWLRPSVVAADAQAVRALYVEAGFLDAAVVPRVEHPESQRRARVVLEITEGPHYRLGSVRVAGHESFAVEELERTFSLATGLPYDDARVRQAEAALQRFYDGRGFPDARVVSEVEVRREAAEIDLVLRVAEGERRTIESVEVTGQGLTREAVVRRELEVEAGQPLSGEALGRSQYNLYRTGLFRGVEIQRRPGDAPGSERVRFALEEAPNFVLDLGLGLDSEEGFRVSGNLAHQNLFGRRLYGGLGGRWSAVDQRVHMVMRQARLFGGPLAGLASGFWEREERESFDAERAGAAVQISREFDEGRRQLLATYTLKDERLSSAIPAALGGLDEAVRQRLGSLTLGFVRNTRDAFFWPTRGSYGRIELSLFDQALLSDAEFTRGILQWSHHRQLGRSLVWGSGLRLGLAEPHGNSDLLPLSERFFAGGESSLRGHKLDSLVAAGAPRTLDDGRPGQSTGGNAFLVLNQEVSLPLIDPLQGVVFYDVGNLYWTLEEFDPGDLRHSAGLGVRVRTPVGPLRLEYAWKLDRRRGESPGRLHFSIGLPF